MTSIEAYYVAVEVARQLTPEDMRSLADYLNLLADDREGEEITSVEQSQAGTSSR